MPLFRSLALGAALATMLCAANSAKGVTQTGWEYNRLNRPSDTIGTVGSGLFGEQVDLYSGGTEFSTTDISIPGNSGLPVRLGRRLKVEEADQYGGLPSFANWEVDVPYLSTNLASFRAVAPGWAIMPGPIGTPATYNRCSVPVDHPEVAGPPFLQGSDSALWPTEYWSGYQMYVPGAGSQEMLVNTSSSPHPSDGNTYRWVTRNNWTFRCLPTLQSGGTGEGFLAISPDGTKYTFDRMMYRGGSDEQTLAKPFASGLGYDIYFRYKYWLLATRAEDRFGNWVTYTYNANNQLTQIQANDGRNIQITYGADGYIASASTSTHTWAYQYTVAPAVLGDNRIPKVLSAVVQPDGSSWSYQYDGNLVLTDTSPASDGRPVTCDAKEVNRLTGGAQYYTLTATHPSGATGVFHFIPLIRGRSYVTRSCFSGGANFPKESAQFALQTKTLSGPGLPTYAWQYAYSPSNGSWSKDCTTGCPNTAWTDVTNPDGTRTRRTFGDQFQTTEGQLQETTVYQAITNTVLDDETTTYVGDPTGQPFPAKVGVSPNPRSNTFMAQTLHPLVTKVQVRDGVTFNSHINTFDAYANPISQTVFSSLGSTRTDLTQYDYNTNLWVLGQVRSVQNSDTGAFVFNKTYDPATALLSSVSSYGLFDQSYTFLPDGNLATVTDGNNHTVTLSNYYRGVPRSLVFPNSTSKTAMVDDDGHITSLTDEMGYTSTFGYDPMGRLSSIAQPTGDSVAWTPTTISFAQIASAEYALPAGHWKQTVSTGNATKVSYLDGFWQPVLTQEYDNASPATTTRFTSKSFDFAGRTTFASYPGTTSTLTTGSRTTFDGLGRPIQSVQDSELGALTTSQTYLTGFQTRVTNPRGYATTTSYQVFDSPDTSHPIQIASPESALTTISRDVFGKPLALTRTDTSNPAITTTRNFVYDANQRLCKHIEPESGATLMDYDGANNIAWTVTGSALTSPTCDRASVAAADKTVRSYDALNRPLTVDVPYTTNDLAYSYFADGALQTLTSGASTWSYSYNKRRLPVTEQLSIDGRLSTITHTYNALGQQSSLTYPSGLVVATNPNALGQPTQAGTYATGISYFANGGMSGFIYGNGIVHTLTQNARFLPQRSLDIKPGSAAVLDDTYSYDANANVASITDGTTGNGGNRTMTYDGLDRLTSTYAPHLWWINATTHYDALDNILSNTVGYRTYNYAYDATSRRLSQLIRPDNSVAYTLGYDAFGNVTSKGSGQDSYAFDAANRMTGVAGKESYSYDGYGRRVKITRLSDNKLDYPIYTMGGQLLSDEDQRSNKSTDYIDLNGSLVAKRSTPIGANTWTTTYEHTDALHSPIAETDSAGNFSRIELYTPYGEPNDSAYVQGPGYTGHVTDAATGLTYAQQRYYDPIIGRFLSVDSVSADPNTGAHFNRYSYANGNPYRFTDPDGRNGVEAFGGLLYQTGQFLSGNGFDGKSVAGALTDGYNGEGQGAVRSAVDDATSFIPAGAVAGAAIKVARLIGIARNVERVVQASKGIKQAISGLNKAGASQKQVVKAVTSVVENSGREVGGVVNAEKGAKVMSGVVEGKGQDVVIVAKDGQAAMGSANVAIDRATGQMTATDVLKK